MNKISFIFIGIAILTGWWAGYTHYQSQAIDDTTSATWTMPVAANCADEGKSVIFSCAMHTQVKRAEKGQCPICGMALTTAIRNLYRHPLKLKMSPAAVALSNIQTQKVQTAHTQTQTLQLQGIIRAEPGRQYQQIAHLPGRIEKLYVNEVGAYVHKGQPIASIYSKELIAVIEAFEYSKHSESVLRSAENNLYSWNISPEKFKKMDLSKEDYRKPVDIHADFSGIITKTYVQPGAHAANSHMSHPTVLYELADLSRVWGVFEIHESQLQWVKKGQKLTFRLQGIPGQVFTAAIEQVSPEVDPLTAYASIRVSINNPDLKLRPGMLATAEVEVSTEFDEPGISIPSTAVLWTGEESVVYVKHSDYKDPVYECRLVRLGCSNPDTYLVHSGLLPGEEVVVSGVIRLDAAAQLERKYSMMNLEKPGSDAEF